MTLTMHRQTQGMFLFNGLLFGTWAILVPSIQQAYHLTALDLAAELFMIMLGNLLALPVVTRLLKTHGPKFTAMLSFSVMAAGFLLLPVSGNPYFLGLCLLIYGIGFGGVDCALNTVGGWLEGELGRSIMSSLHGSFSVGALVAGALGGLLLRAEVGLFPHLLGVSLLTLLCGVLLSRTLPAALPQEDSAPGAQSGVSRLLVLVLVAGFGAALAEGTVNDWSAVFTQQVVGVGTDLASLSFTAFSALMVLGRFTGDALTNRFGSSPVGFTAALLTVAGLGLVTLGAAYPLVVLGFAVCGLGLSVLAPLAFSAAWRAGAGRGIALMTAVFYGGFLFGPPAAGLVVHQVGLNAVFSLPLVFVLLSFVLIMLGAFREGRVPLPVPAEALE